MKYQSPNSLHIATIAGVLSVLAGAAQAAVTAAPRHVVAPIATPGLMFGAAAPNSSDAQRIAAATSTAQSTTNSCSTVHPFYWEIGDSGAKLASGSVNGASGTTPVTSTLVMSIASASKWIYGAYVAQIRGGKIPAADLPFLDMRSGYTEFGGCSSRDTVASCVASGTNGVYVPSTANFFDYGGGHMQNHASLMMGIGSLNNKTLANAIRTQVGSQVALRYSSPQLAGGLDMSADAYAVFLRELLGKQLQMSTLLGSSPVCTNPKTCSTAISAPIPANESWHYSIAHWIEDDPVVGDGAFSSPGAFGFYPWIDAARSYYGVLARKKLGGAFTSVQCGRLIRKSWETSTPM